MASRQGIVCSYNLLLHYCFVQVPFSPGGAAHGVELDEVPARVAVRVPLCALAAEGRLKMCRKFPVQKPYLLDP